MEFEIRVKVFCIVMLLLVVVYGNEEEQLLNVVSKMEGFLSRKLPDQSGITLTRNLKKIEADLRKTAEHESREEGKAADKEIKAVLDKVSDKLDMFTNNDPAVSAAAVSVLLYDIGSRIDQSVGFTPKILREVFSGLLGLLTSDRIARIIESLVKDALGSKPNEELAKKAGYFTEWLHSFKYNLDSFRAHEEQSSTADLSKMALKIEKFNNLPFIDAIKDNIDFRLSDSDDAPKVITLVALLSELGKLIDVCLLDSFNTIVLSGQLPKTAVAVLNTRNDILSGFRDTLQFLRLKSERKRNSTLVLSRFYPPSHSPITKQIDKFLDYLQIPRVSYLPAYSDEMYRLMSGDEKGYQLCGYLRVHVKNVGSIEEENEVEGCRLKAHPNMKSRLVRDEDGFFEILVPMNGKESNLVAMLITEEGDKVRLNFGLDNVPNSNLLKFRFVPFNDEKKLFLISPQKYPSKFLIMESKGKRTVKLQTGDPGPTGYWKIG